MINNITTTEIDIQIAGTRLFDYFRDLLMLSGAFIPFSETYQEMRIQFGDACVQMVRAIKDDIRNEKLIIKK